MNRLEPHDFVIIRRPLLPYSMLRTLNGRLVKNPASLKVLLCQAYKRPVLREALYLASPALYQALTKLEDSDVENCEQKVLLSLYKYLVRASSRCTPFGLFAGYFPAILSERTHISFNGKLKKHTTLSAQVLQYIAGKLSAEMTNERLRVNSSLYSAGDYLRFTQRECRTDGRIEFALKEIRNDHYLQVAFRAVGSGAIASQVANALSGEGLSEWHAAEYVSHLRTEQILVDNTEPLLSLSDFQNVLTGRAGHQNRLANVLRQAAEVAKSKRDNPLRFKRLEKSLALAGIGEDNPLQIDVEFETTQSTISRKAVDEIVSGLGKLLNSAKNQKTKALESFCARFYQRYGERQVPLLQALDPGLGIGYGLMQSSYFGHIPIASSDQSSQTSLPSEVERIKLIERVFHSARQSKRPFYLLTDEDLELIRPETPPTFPEGLSVLGNIFCLGQADFDRSDFFFELRGVSGPGSLDLVSRFADADKALAKRLKIIKAEEAAQYPETILAEIHYAPAGREANVVRRPALGSYHITLLCGPEQSGTAIAASDLMISVADGRLILSSASLQKRVIPRLTTAHNPSLGPAAYQFLADLTASESRLSALWDWGHLSQCPFLPRIQYGNIVIRKACWNLGASFLPTGQLSDAEIVAWWQRTRKELNMPRIVQIGSGDQLLAIDGHAAPAVRICLNKLRKEKKLCVQEPLQSAKSGLLENGRQVYCNEIVIPIFHRLRSGTFQTMPAPVAASTLRWVTSQDGWTYMKIYTSEETADRLLIGKLFDFCLQQQKANRIQGWFFLRYKDPEPHLRLRLYTGPRKHLAGRLACNLAKKLKDEIENGLVFRLQSELYERELERYSCMPYEAVESIFCHDSYAVTSCLALLQLDGRQTDRWLVALLACDGLMNAFGKQDPTVKLETLQAAGSFLDKTELISLDQQFRQCRDQIVDALTGRGPAGDKFSDLRRTLSERDARISDIQTQHPVNEPMREQKLLIDLMHLCCNRLFISDQRRQEHAIYHFLKKLYNYQLNSKKYSLII